MIRLLMLALLAAPFNFAFAQEGSSPENRRYLNPIFDAVKFTGDIVYSDKGVNDDDRQAILKMRVFEPAGDAETSRPLLLITPGGGFVVSDETWMNEFGEEIAKAGYVVALNSYRLSDNIDTPENYANALAKAVEDQRAAIQYLLDDANNANRFGIDPSRIFIGGHSAGAITSMHTAYLDNEDPLLPLMRHHYEERGLLTEHKNKAAIKGVISLSGLLTNLAIIDRNDIPLLSLHGDKDSVINVNRDEQIFGSIAIHQYTDIVDTENELHVIKGALHNDTATPSLCEECIPLIKRFMFNQLTRKE